MKAHLAKVMAFVMAANALTLSIKSPIIAETKPNMDNIAIIDERLQENWKIIEENGTNDITYVQYVNPEVSEQIVFGTTWKAGEKQVHMGFDMIKKLGDIYDHTVFFNIYDSKGASLYAADLDLDLLAQGEIQNIRRYCEKDAYEADVYEAVTDLAELKELKAFNKTAMNRMNNFMIKQFDFGLAELSLPEVIEPDEPEKPVKPVKPANELQIKSLKLEETSFEYTGKAICPTVKVTDASGKLVNKKNYKVTYTNNREVGRATVKVVCKGGYTGTLTADFIINPKSTKLTAIKRKSNKLEIKWKKQSVQTTGYEIWYSTDKKFKKSVNKLNIKKNTIIKTTIKKVKKKTYYVKLRTYKTVKGVKYYSKWSSVKKCNVIVNEAN